MTDRPQQPPLDELDPSAEELAEATALARALEREVLAEAQHDAVLPALEAAHLLRALQAPDLSEARLDAVYQSLEASLPPRPPVTDATGTETATGTARALRRLLGWATAGLVVASVVLWFGLPRKPGEAPVGNLPVPSVELLAAQAAAMDRRARGQLPGDGTHDEDLTRAMRPYRAELLAQLEAEYGP